ncbi:hypothetical protein [Nocardia wallacei]|uniref:hypothetical protein n=1 Tax=Nocardia wallacei TaxID=480035 RepID=UPI0024542934|nr:hypothetical protein [Nocardia wallacei]
MSNPALTLTVTRSQVGYHYLLTDQAGAELSRLGESAITQEIQAWISGYLTEHADELAAGLTHAIIETWRTAPGPTT